jgi:hypothetical protein
MKHAYTVYINDYSRGGIVTDENMIICDETNLVFAINKLLSRDSPSHGCVCVKRCELMTDPTNTDQYRMGAWGKTKGE